jgi:hypothetical protein
MNCHSGKMIVEAKKSLIFTITFTPKWMNRNPNVTVRNVGKVSNQPLPDIA